MTLTQYLVYAAVTAAIVLVVGSLLLILHSYLERLTFLSNTTFSYELQTRSMKEILDGGDAEFNHHVATTPGIRDLNK